MSTPPSQKPPLRPDELEAQTSTRWMLWSFLGLLAAAAAWWFFFDEAALAARNWWGRRHIPAIEAGIEAEDWANAAKNLHQATRWAPDDPEVLRAAVQFVTRTGSEPRTMLRFLGRLQELGVITVAERCLMGRMHVRLPDLKTAHEIYDALPAGEMSKRPALELLAEIQKAEGLHARSFLTQRQALLADPENPDSVLQLALLDARSGDASLSGPARERLWPIARRGDAKAAPAVEFLAQHRQLTAAEGAELLQIVEAMPEGAKTEALRFKVLSAVLRLNPHRRHELLNKELQKWGRQPPANLGPLLEWLVAEREHERILRIVSAQTAAVYGAVLPHYIAALRGEKRWAAIKQMVVGKVDPSFPRVQLRLWLAEAESHLSEDPATPRQILSSLLEESGRGEHEMTATLTAQLAEQLGQWDIARRCYEALTARHPTKAIPLLTKVYDAASHELNGQAMLQASEKLCDLKPTDMVFLDRVNYLRLVLGTDLEVAQRALDEAAKMPPHHITPDRHIALSLLRALAAYRSGHRQEIAPHLARVSAIDTFPPGPRAVYAGLMAVSGDTAGGYKIAEFVPEALLLPEERRFLKKAL
jgi:hypothetical protein